MYKIRHTITAVLLITACFFMASANALPHSPYKQTLNRYHIAGSFQDSTRLYRHNGHLVYRA